jgi:XTP/dITP diphosphohydrolase
MTTLLISTRNAHKIGEIRSILGASFYYWTLDDFPHAPEVVEDADTFAGNAAKKAMGLAKWVAIGQQMPPRAGSASPGPPSNNQDLFVLADDSGLEVDALDGAPGVHSARFAALDSGRPGNSSDADNRVKLLRLLQAVPLGQRTARFRCVLALTPMPGPSRENASPVCYSDELELSTQLFEGACEGRIAIEPKGPGGFGYDSLFIPEGYKQTFGELSSEVKNRLSHRAKALAELRRRLVAA